MHGKGIKSVVQQPERVRDTTTNPKPGKAGSISRGGRDGPWSISRSKK